ncbi:hypothetical protein DOTSEDRAFT_70980, partial [Dothistroma septosporum NZE10]
MECAIGTPDESPPRGILVQQPSPSSTMHNDNGVRNTAHPFGVIGQEVKAASHTSTASTCSSDDREGGDPVDTFTSSRERERAGSLRELVEQSTPIESIAFESQAERFDCTPSCHHISPTNSERVMTELFSRSPVFTLQAAPQSTLCNFGFPPSHVIDPFRSATCHLPLPPFSVHIPPEFNFQHHSPTTSANGYRQVNRKLLPPPMRGSELHPAAPPNSSPERI